MKKYFEEKPTDIEVTEYENKLNEILKHVNTKVKINVSNVPREIKSWINDSPMDSSNMWIDSIEVTNPKITFQTTLFSQVLGRPGKVLDEKLAWGDAQQIQEELYSKLGIIPGSPQNSKDPYWKLWEMR